MRRLGHRAYKLKTTIIGTSSPFTRPNHEVVTLARECNRDRDDDREYDRKRDHDLKYNHVLDVGCGNGRHFIFPLTVGIDADLMILKKAKKKGICLCGDGQNLPLRPGIFDLALFSFSLEYMEDPDRARKEGQRVARGTFELVYPGRYTWDIVTGQGRQS